MSNTVARISEVPRCEAVCVLCARKDFIEQRHMLNLFALPPKDDQRIEFASREAFQLARTDGEEAEEQDAEEDNFTSSRLIKRDRVYYVQNQKRSTICSALNDTQRVGLSYPAQSCTLPAFNTRCVQSGDGCCTADACQ